MVAAGRLKLLKIEIDGHFHGSPVVPKPWVARITGTDPRFGLGREFVKALNDWEHARTAMSGNLYGVVANFPLREGHVYEVSRLRGSSSKRHVAREFVELAAGRFELLDPLDALARVEAHADPTVVHEVAEASPDDPVRVSEVVGVGTGPVLGWVVVDGRRMYRLRVGRLYEVLRGTERKLVLAEEPRVRRMDQREALQWLAARV